jgi:hypothetical protein
MHQLRIVLVLLLIGAMTPVVAFFLGASLYQGASSRVTNALWAPPLALQSAFESTCTRPLSGTFACPYGQGQHNRLFLTSFVLVYFAVGMAVAGAGLSIWRWRRRPNTSLERTRER